MTIDVDSWHPTPPQHARNCDRQAGGCAECRWRDAQEEKEERGQRSAFLKEYGTLSERVAVAWVTSGRNMRRMSDLFIDKRYVFFVTNWSFDAERCTVEDPYSAPLSLTVAGLDALVAGLGQRAGGDRA